jgi:hypothetical protein
LPLAQVQAHFVFRTMPPIKPKKTKRAFPFFLTLCQSGILFNYFPPQKKIKTPCTQPPCLKREENYSSGF